MTYSTTSDLTKRFCQASGFIFSVAFVTTLKRGSKIFISATLGKPEEWQSLRRKVAQMGEFEGCQLVYKGR